MWPWQDVDRLTLIDELSAGPGCAWLVLRTPVFLRRGERYRPEPAGLAVLHSDGSRSFHVGAWETRRYQ
ncbi:hypothetical protein ACFP2T_04935 [Plantactinospora solaniradicis]|uniref:Uncharacterized protein n=1 Tax=Plantactinospora solaniradicis TaxID=1723736 RepID=A0ABW1K2R6_9ACTN